MLKTRVIPVLLWDGGNLCLQTTQYGQHNTKPRIVGSMMDMVRNMDARSVDELFVIDINATREWRQPNFDKLKQFTSEVFSPVTYGGGITNLYHIEQALKAGADKVAICDAALQGTRFLNEAGEKFGAQCITVVVNSRRVDGEHFVCSYDGSRRGTPQNGDYTWRYVKHLAENANIGEIVLSSVDRNGTYMGYDNDLIREIREFVRIPLVALGGCGEPDHMLHAMVFGANAVAASSMFLFTEITPLDCCEHLRGHGIPVRIDNDEAKEDT